MMVGFVGEPVGRQGPSTAEVEVKVAQPEGQAVWQGRKDVTVGVVGQCVFRPGMVRVLEGGWGLVLG